MATQPEETQRELIPPAEGLLVAPAPYRLAKKAVTRWHYSRSLPTGKLVSLGVWEDARFVGIVIFSRGASPWVPYRWGLKKHELCELTRIAMRDHKVAVSRVVSISLRILKKTNPGVRLVLSFADPEQDHHGGIYQASNFVYTGESNPVMENFIDGRWQHVRSSHWKAKAKGGVPTRIRRGKHRYVYVFDPSLRPLVEEKRVEPLPKRTKQSGVAPPVQGGGGGSIPTRALPLDEVVSRVCEQVSGRDELLKPGARLPGQTHPLSGHCYVVAEVVYHLGAREAGYRPEHLRWEGGVHWRLRHAASGELIDPTAPQFENAPPPEIGRGGAFLTRKPSRRALVVIEELGGL